MCVAIQEADITLGIVVHVYRSVPHDHISMMHEVFE